MSRKYSFGDIINDDFAIFGEIWSPSSVSVFRKGFYDDEEYELVPKKKHFERRLKEKEQQLANVESIIGHYIEQQKKLKQEIDELRGKLSP